MKKIIAELLIFDLDGTLIDSKYDLAYALELTANELNLPALLPDKVAQLLGDGAAVLVSKVFGFEKDSELHQKAFQIFTKYYSQNLCNRTQIYPNVFVILTHFQHKKKAVLSNKPDAFTKQILQELNLAPYFDFILGQTPEIPRKPAPDALFHILEKLNVTPENALIIGDGDTDIAAGKAAGVRTCAVTYGYRTHEQLAALKPDFIIDNLTEIKEIII